MLLLEYWSLLKLLQSQKSAVLPVEKQNVLSQETACRLILIWTTVTQKFGCQCSYLTNQLSYLTLMILWCIIT